MWNHETLERRYHHVTSEVAASMAPTVGPAHSLSPAEVQRCTELLMLAHAGDPEAREAVEQMARQYPGMKTALTALSLQLRMHPHFGAYQGEADMMRQQNAIVGFHGGFHPSYHRRFHHHRPDVPSSDTSDYDAAFDEVSGRRRARRRRAPHLYGLLSYSRPRQIAGLGYPAFYPAY